MALEGITKQGWESFPVAGDFTKVAEVGELAVLVGSSVLAEDKDGNNVATIVTDQTSLAVSGTQLRVQIKAGTEAASPYKITFRILTSLNNKYEIDFDLAIKEL